MRRAAPWIALFALALAPYLGALRAPLLYDDRTLLDNPWMAREAGPATVFLHDFWHGSRHEGSDLYRPLTVLSLAWNLRLAQGAAGFRAVNFLLHAIVTLLAAGFLRSVLQPGAPLRFRSAAWIGAALFAVHPLASEPVLWASGRSELLAAGFGLTAFLFVADGARLTPARIAGSAVAFAAAMLCKESAACWVPIALTWAWLDPLHLPQGRTGRRWVPAIVFAGVVVAFLVARSAVVGARMAPPPDLDNPLVAVGAATRIANAFLLHARYLAKMALPLRLSVDYGFAQIRVLPLGVAALGAALLVAGWIVALRLLRRRALPLAFLWVFVGAGFVVTGNWLMPIGTIFAERLTYLALVGFCALGGAALATIRPGAVRVAVVIAILAALSLRTGLRAHDYRGMIALTEATAAASPDSAKALVNLGRVRLEIQHRPGDAIAPLTRAVAIAPGRTQAENLLARARAETR